MDTLNLIALTAVLAVGLHYFAKLLDRHTRKFQREERLKKIRQRNYERDLRLGLSRASDRSQPEAVDAMVLRHLRG